MPVTQLTCPNCRQPFSAMVEQLIDVSRDPQQKARLLAGRINAVTCPHCGFQTILSTPLVYHDPDKQLLIIHVPMELNLPKQEQERVIGSLTNAVVNSLPADKRKGYLFTPKQVLTLQSMIEMILEADGVTPEMIEAQREKMRLVETFLQTESEKLPELVQQYDDKIDAEFFAMLVASAEAALAGNREDVAQSIVQLREELINLSSYGQQALANASEQQAMIQEVAERFNTLDEQATHDDVVNLVLELARDGDEKLQVTVGLARPLLDYNFFQALTGRAEAAGGEEKEFIEATRTRLLELVGMVDQQNEAIVKRATDTLSAIVNSPDIDAAINTRLDLIDDTFLQVLSYNIQAAEQAKNIASAAKLKTIFDKVVALLQASAPPAIQFLNQVMTLSSFEEAKAMIAERAPEFGPDLLQWVDMLGEDLSERGNNAALDRLGRIRDEIERVLATSPAPSLATPGQRPAPSAPADEPKPAKPLIELPSFRSRPRRER